MFEKEAEESSKKAFCIAHTHEDELIYRNGFQQGAEFGYNKAKAETTLLSQHIIDLQKDKGNLTDRVRELEQQIEKMKRCSICKYSSNLGYCKIRCNGGECNKMDKWELAD